MSLFNFLRKIYLVNVKKTEYDIFIGRGSIWGNPFKIGKDGNRDSVIKKYEEYILNNKELLTELPNLYKKKLGCFCYPKKCHGDVLIKILYLRKIGYEN